jgi:hypothetical protein
VLNPLLNYKSVGIYAKLTHRTKNEEATFDEGTQRRRYSSCPLPKPITHDPQLTGSSSSRCAPGQDATYHLVKNAADDRVLLREKAKYILSHFLGVLETKTTPQFNPKVPLGANHERANQRCP